MSGTVRKMEDVYRSSRPWLSPVQRERVEAVRAPFRLADGLLVSARDIGSVVGARVDPVSHAMILGTIDVGGPIEALDAEVTRLAGAPSLLERIWDVVLNGLIRPSSREDPADGEHRGGHRGERRDDRRDV